MAEPVNGRRTTVDEHNDGRGLGPLPDGGTAVIVGGGPGGTAAAIMIKRLARDAGRSVRVVLVEGKQFADAGQHNQCAGVLSPPIGTLLQRDLGLAFPQHLSRGEIAGYVLHAGGRSIVLDDPAAGTNGAASIALRRIQFDSYMLAAARQQGVEVLCGRVTDLEFHPGQAIVYTELGPLAADVVVGAFGLDEGAAAIFARATPYRPPPALSAVVTKYHPGDEAMERFGKHIHAFLPPSPAIEFGAVTPKGNHLTVNIGGAAVDARQMQAFLRLPEVRQVLPAFELAGLYDPDDLRYFRGRFPCGLARGYTGDRYVIVGDAAGLVRAFKGKGVTSAIQTGIRAARVIVCEGLSARAFQSYQAANRDITGDLVYGQGIRRLTIVGARFGLMRLALRAAGRSPGLRQALFDAVSAHNSYREVVGQTLAPGSLAAITTALLRRASD